jgi:hypothetical protein
VAGQVADRVLVKLLGAYLDEHPQGSTVKDVTAEFGMSADTARRLLGEMVDSGAIAYSPRPGEGAGLYRRPDDFERRQNTWLNEAKARLRGTFGDGYHLSIASGEPMVTLPLSYLDVEELGSPHNSGPWTELESSMPRRTFPETEASAGG